MDNLENSIMEYLESRYNSTRFQFIPLHELTTYFGEDIDLKPALNALRKKNLINRREGGNYVLVEIIK
jgi:hypothetical protein